MNFNNNNNNNNNVPTEKDKEKEYREKRIDLSIQAIRIMLQSWAGLIVLASHPLGLRALVDALQLPSHTLHEKLLDAIFEIFRIPPPKASNPLLLEGQEHSVDDSGKVD